MSFEKSQDFFRFLVGNQSAGDLCRCDAWNDGFASFSLITGCQAVDLQGWSGGPTFHGVKVAFAEQFAHAQVTRKFCVFVREAFGLVTFQFAERRDIIIKSRDGDASVGVSQLGQHLAKDHGRIVHRTSVNARMQIPVGTGQGDLAGRHAAESVGQGRMFQVGHAVVGNHNGGNIQFRLQFFQSRGE